MFKTLSAAYFVFVGILIIFTWIILISSGEVTELDSQPISMGFHLFSEAILSLVLILSGALLFIKKKYAACLFFLSLGLLSCSVVHAGLAYYEFSDSLAPVFAFMILIIINLILLLYAFIKKEKMALDFKQILLNAPTLSQFSYFTFGWIFYSLINVAGEYLEVGNIKHFIHIIIGFLFLSILIIYSFKGDRDE